MTLHRVAHFALFAVSCGGEVSTQSDESCTMNMNSLGHVEEIAGGATVCARYSSGHVWCWGDNAMGQLGNPDGYPQSHTPLPVLGVDCTIELGGNNTQVCVRRQAGRVWCWGEVRLDAGPGGFEPVRIPEVDGAVQVALSSALQADGEVWFWGDWHWDMPHAPAPLRYTPVGQVAALPRQGVARCFVTADRGVRCFGGNIWGEVGDGTNEPHVEPVDVVGLDSVVQLAADFDSAAALLGDGTVAAWGSGGVAGVGHGDDVLLPEKVVTTSGVLTDVAAVSLTFATACVLRLDKSVWCWGLTGQGDHINSAVEATPIWGLGAAIQVAAGFDGACALLEDRTVWCWGDNTYGQLGHGGFEDFSEQPVQVALPTE